MWAPNHRSPVPKHSTDSHLAHAKPYKRLRLCADNHEKLQILLKIGGIEDGNFSIHLSAKKVNPVFTDLKASSGESCETRSIINCAASSLETAFIRKVTSIR